MWMVFVKILGAIDLIAGIVFLMLVFGFDLHFQILIYSAGLLFLKGMFIIGGDVLSVIDLFSAIVLISSVFIGIPTILLWIGAFFLFGKGFVSFF
jgi:hypothetical protein